MAAAVVVKAIGAAAGLLTAGNSVATTVAGWASLDYTRKFKMELENYTNEYLTVHHNRCRTGLIADPPSPVAPAYKEAMTGHKTSNTATGIWGGWYGC